jgi:8-amino-7-oxononanoate synthase
VNTVAAMGAERNRLERNITLFRSIIHDGSLELMPSDSAIQCIVIPGNEAVKAKAEQIRNGGFAVKAILSPTVPEGRERIRICLHSFNTEEEIKSLGQLING